MCATLSNIKYIEWLSAEDMHAMSIQWLSELDFITDEHNFFNDLITAYTHELVDTKSFSQNKQLIDHLSEILKQNEHLIKELRVHENNLKIMVDGIDQLEEEKRYKDHHRQLDQNINAHLKKYKAVKSDLFSLIKQILKSKKSKKRLNN